MTQADTAARTSALGRGGRGARRWGAALIAVALLVPLLVTFAGPASPAAAVTGPDPIPDGLWDTNPAVGAGQSYVAFDGTAGDPVTGGVDHLFTQADSLITVTEGPGLIAISVKADDAWRIQMKAPSGVDPMVVGYYPNATRYPFNDSAVPGLAFSALTGCNQVSGWFAVDSITLVAGAVTQLTARFSQSCDGSPASFGKVRYFAADTTLPPGPQSPVPGDLWDVTPAVPSGVSYLALEGAPGDPWLNGGSRLFTSAYSSFSLVDEHPEGEPDRLALVLRGDEQWTARWQPMWSLQAMQVGYYPDTTDFRNVARGQMALYGPNSCHVSPTNGWIAVDEVTRVAGVTTAVTLRFEQTCEGSPPIHGKLRWLASDPGVAPGPQAVPGDLWDVQPPVGPNQTYAVLSAPVGEPVSGGVDRTFTKADSVITLAESGRTLSLQVEAEQSWTGTFVGMNSIDSLQVGYYPAVHDPTTNLRRASMAWAPASSAVSCATGSGWFAVDQITRASGTVTSATIRFGFSCDGVHTLNGKVRWNAADTTTPPGPVTPVPGGLWDVTPSGVIGNYTFIDGVPGDPVSGGVDVVLQDPQHPGIPADYQGGIASIIGSGDPQDFWTAEFYGAVDPGTVQPGYYPNLSWMTSPNPALGGLRVTHFSQGGKSCTPGATTGWFAIDHLGRIDGQMSRLDLRFEQSCDGNPPMHGRLHFDLGGLEVGPPIGAFESVVPVTGGVKVDGWALDPETASAIDVDVLVDGVVTTTLTASGDRPDVGAANPVYGNGHGFSADVAVPVGTHQVCTNARNTGVGADTTLGCKTVNVGSGSPFGSLDSAVGVPGGVSVSGWVIDPDVAASAPVAVFVDGVGVAVMADGDRPDVGAAFAGYGNGHGFSVVVPIGAGGHRVCAYGINVGAGADSVVGCRSVVVPGGSPFGSLDSAVGVPGGVSVSGWVIDPDVAASAPVAVFVDGVGVAVMADGDRPDVGAAFAGYGNGHGFSVVVPIGAGGHRVCAYGINVGAGADSVVGCRSVVVPGGSPFGSLDSAVGVPGGVSVSGWVIDPDVAASAPVAVFVDGVGVAVMADGDRPDVGAAFAGYGNGHGFSVVVPIGAGGHRVCAYGINVGAGADSVVGCRSVVVPGGSPFGSLDSAVGVPGGVSVSGWVIDPDVAASAPVAVFVDGVGVAVMADGDRPDVGAAFAGYGNGHGFSVVVPIGAGGHRVCAYGINVGAGADSEIGCAAVVVS